MDKGYSEEPTPEELRQSWLDEQRGLMNLMPDFFLAPGIHMRALPVFKWWVSIYQQLLDAEHWFRMKVIGTDRVQRTRQQHWWEDVTNHLVPMGLFRVRSVVELATTVKPYSMKLVVDWSKKTWRDASLEVLQAKNLLPPDWPEFAKIEAKATHWGITDTWAIGWAIRADFRSASDIASAVNQYVERPLDVGISNHLRFLEIEGVRVFGPATADELQLSDELPLLLPPFVEAPQPTVPNVGPDKSEIVPCKLNEWKRQRKEHGATVQDQMAILWKNDDRAAEWKAKEFAAVLECSESSVKSPKNRTWRAMQEERAKRLIDRQRRSRNQ